VNRNRSERAQNGVVAGSLRRTGLAMFVVAFIGVIALLTWLSTDFLDRRNNPNRNAAGTVADGSREITLKANRFGHYIVPGLINDEEVIFYLDTGATTVSIPSALADRLGLERGASIQAETAAGIVETFMTSLDSISLGPIVLQNVRATINPHTSSEDVLLGMSFLRHLELIQKDEELTLRL